MTDISKGHGSIYTEKSGSVLKELERAIGCDARDFEAYKKLIEAYFYMKKYNKIAEITNKLKALSFLDKDFRIRYLFVKGELLRAYRGNLEKGEDLRRVLSDIHRRIALDNYSPEEEKTILRLLVKDFLSEGDCLRGEGEDATALLKYNSVLSFDPDNKKARGSLYFAEKFVHSSNRPHFCAISISFRCMLKCKMCRIWENSEVDELSIETWKTIVDDLAVFMDDNRTINFAGGEPLLKDDLVDLINYSSKKGFKPAICTNAWLIDKDMAKRLVDSGIDIVAISLDSLNEKTHDYLRGVEGSYKRVMNAIEYLTRYNKNNKIRVHVQPIISGVNLEDLMDLTHWVNRYEGVGDITFLAAIQPPHTNSDYQEWYKKEEFSMLWPQDKNKVASVMDELIKLKIKDKEKSYKIGNQVFQLEAYKEYFRDPLRFYKKNIQCNIGTQFVNIHTNGDMKLCNYSDIVIGNLAKQKIKDIWDSEFTNSIRDKLKVCDKKCHQILNCMKDESPYIDRA